MKSIQVSWPHVAGALSIVLGSAGCAMTAPMAERYVAPPMGATWVSERRDTGSYGSATVQLPGKRGEFIWEGKPHVTFETPESTTVSRPEGGFIGVFRDGKPLMMWNPPANFEWPLTVGATFSKNYSLTMYPAQQTVTYTSTSRVEAYEDVTVPAGTFKAFKVRTTDTIGNDNVVWFSPEFGIFVKQMVRSRSGGKDSCAGRTTTGAPPSAGSTQRLRQPAQAWRLRPQGPIEADRTYHYAGWAPVAEQARRHRHPDLGSRRD
jgi:hypothetical protein